MSAPFDVGRAAPTTLSAEERTLVRRAGTALAVLGTGSLIGVSFSLVLVNHAPLLLIALSPIGRHMLLVAPMVDPLAFAAVLVGRRMLFYVASYHLGFGLGPAGIVWLEARSRPMARFVRFVERWFARSPRAVVLLAAGPTVSSLAGMTRMPLRVFLSLATVSLVIRVVATIVLAEWLRVPIEALLELIDAYWLPGTVVLVAFVLGYRWWLARTGLAAGASMVD